LRGGVDRAYQRSLIERFDLDPSRRFREYSKGNKQKVGLIVALQHRPELLILDEPTAGLDPLVQQTFFEVLREAVAEERTVFLSSHVLSEAEKTCDRVAIIREGRLVKVDRVDALRNLAVHEVELRFTGPVPAEDFRRIVGVTNVVVDDHVLRMHVAGPIAPAVKPALRTRGQGGAPLRAGRLRQPGGEPRGALPRRVRPRGVGGGQPWPLSSPVRRWRRRVRGCGSRAGSTAWAASTRRPSAIRDSRS